MLRIYLIIILTILVVSGCGTSVSQKPEEAPAASNEESVKLEETVPKFEDATVALKKGVQYLDANYVDQAIDALKQAVELDENLAEAHFQLGVALSLRESADEKTVSDEFLDDSTPAKNEKKEKAGSEVAFENAVKAYKKLIAKNKDDHQAYYNLGRSYSKLFDDANARKALEKAVKLNDEDSLYRTELGAVLIKLAQYPLAIRQLDKALEIDESNYRAEDLLVKAKAGKKRVDHVQKERGKTLSSSNASPQASSSDSSDQSATTRPRKVDDESDQPKKADNNKAPPPSKPKKKNGEE